MTCFLLGAFRRGNKPQFYWGKKDSFSKSCAACGLSSEGTADEATFFSGNALDHDWGAWTQNSDEKTHTRICKRDTSHTETENCHGGTQLHGRKSRGAVFEIRRHLYRKGGLPLKILPHWTPSKHRAAHPSAGPG